MIERNKIEIFLQTFGTWHRQRTFLVSWSTEKNIAAKFGEFFKTCFKAESKAYYYTQKNKLMTNYLNFQQNSSDTFHF